MKRQAAAALMLTLVGCGAGQDPVARRMTVVLEASGVVDGAIVLTLSGGPVGAIVAHDRELSQFTDARGMHLLIVGDLTPGPLLSFETADARDTRAYVVTVDQLADAATFALRDPAAARVKLVRAE